MSPAKTFEPSPEKFILSPENEALVKSLRETPDGGNFAAFSNAFNGSKDQISLVLKQAMEANSYSLNDVLGMEFDGCQGTLSKNMTGTRPFTMRFEMMQQLRRNVVHKTFDEWIFGKDIPIACPEYLCVCLDMIKKMPQAVYAVINDEMRKAAAASIGTDPNSTIGRRFVEIKEDRQMTYAKICWYENSTLISCILNTMEKKRFTARITTLAYLALVKFDVSLDFLMEDDWSYKDITAHGKRITPGQRSFLTTFLRVNPDEQTYFVGRIIRAGLEAK